MASDLALAEPGEALTAWADWNGIYPEAEAKLRAPTKTEMTDAFETSVSPEALGLMATGSWETEFSEAFDAFFADLVSEIAALKRVDTARIKLAMAGDPLGLRDGDGCANESPDTNAPTPERVAGRGEFEQITMSNGVGRDKSAEAWRKVPIVEAMIRRGQIHRDDAQDYLEAARRFYRDFTLGHRQGGLTARYGDQSGKGGTPISQQNVQYYTDKNGVQHEQLSPDERRTDHHTRWIKACYAIGVYKDPVTSAPRPGRALQWVQKLVCEDYFIAHETTPTLADAGKAYLGCKCSKQAAAAGATLILSSLERLVQHYGLR